MLEWIGHEFSKCLEDLEKLDKTRLQAVAGMYVRRDSKNAGMIRTCAVKNFKRDF